MKKLFLLLFICVCCSQTTFSKCPLERGKGVIVARNLLMQINKGLIVFANNCSTGTRFLNTNDNTVKIKSDAFILYPNPNNGNFTIDYISDSNIDVQITDVTGKVICSYILPANQTQYQLNCEQLQNGIYFCKLFARGNLILTEKLIIIR